MRVLKIWQDWSLYPPDLLDQLREVFTGDSHVPPPTTSAERKTHSTADDDEDVDGVPL